MNSEYGGVSLPESQTEDNKASAGFFYVIIVRLQCWLSPYWPWSKNPESSQSETKTKVSKWVLDETETPKNGLKTNIKSFNATLVIEMDGLTFLFFCLFTVFYSEEKYI